MDITYHTQICTLFSVCRLWIKAFYKVSASLIQKDKNSMSMYHIHYTKYIYKYKHKIQVGYQIQTNRFSFRHFEFTVQLVVDNKVLLLKQKKMIVQMKVCIMQCEWGNYTCLFDSDVNKEQATVGLISLFIFILYFSILLYMLHCWRSSGQNNFIAISTL